MSKSKAPLAIGLTAAGGIGYYLFAAGGSPKVAEKKAEADAHRAAASIKSHLPGRDVGAQGTLGDAAARTGAKIDHAVSLLASFSLSLFSFLPSHRRPES
ncbi:hypothetical protein VDGD_00013 [Verticillium dahliae]|nr:hypothetical protein VDGD_00013 [Verticillium dahliae]